MLIFKGMKKINKIALLLVVLVSLGSCKKFLEEKPLSQVQVSDYFKSVKDINASLAGMYGSFQLEMIGDGVNKYGGKYHYWGEGRSDNFDESGYTNSIMSQLAFNVLTSGNSVSNWEGLYRTIAVANNAIKYFPEIPKYDITATKTIVNNGLAQAYAMRAMCYFYIIRLWGDAPMRTAPYDDLAQEPKLERTSKDVLMDKIIIPDLLNAYELIQKGQTANIWNINEGAVAAMLADVYMWKAGTTSNNGDYANAVTWFQKLFTAKGATGAAYGEGAANLEPTATWKNLFLNPAITKEAIWSIHWDNANNGCACIPVSKMKSNNPVTVDSLIHADWKKNKLDTRVTKTIDTLTGTNHQDKLLKYYNLSSVPTSTKPEDLSVYLVMYRLGDMFLLYAEALNKTGNQTKALSMLNLIHQRAGLPAILPTDPLVSTGGVLDAVKLEDAILKERQYELFGEGKRWFDLVRTNHVNKIMDPIINRRTFYATKIPSTLGFGSNMGRLLWPLYKTLLEDNSKLVQNQPYN
jgi:hypothetical protein